MRTSPAHCKLGVQRSDAGRWPWCSLQAVRLRDVGEFGLIDRIDRAASRLPTGRGVVLGIGDDAAVLRPRPGEDVVVTTDALVENVHFRWDVASPRVIGRRAMVASLSDLAAMGSRPLGSVVALVAPPSLEMRVIDGLVAGILREARAHSCPLVGGNVSRGRHTSLTTTALGACRRGSELRRDGARVGDRILVTGTLGGAALELARAQRGLGEIRRVATPRLRAGQLLARLPGVGACIDVSDGLEADLGQILSPLGLGAALEPGALPLPRGFRPACRRLGLDPVRLAMRGGEDYELLFTLRPDSQPLRSLSRRLGVRVSELGRVVSAGSGEPSPRGWKHF